MVKNEKLQCFAQIEKLFSSIVGLRDYDPNNENICNTFNELTQLIHIDNMIIGHNAQDDGHIKIKKCTDNKHIINIDTARSKMWKKLKHKIPSLLKINFNKNDNYKLVNFEKLYVNYNETPDATSDFESARDKYISDITKNEILDSMLPF